MKFFVRNTNGHTLLLIDEFGSGTEPLIGGAIAEAVLERFNHNRSFGVITTHYHNLKQYADNTPGIVNGAMLYDRHLMQPLFKLSIGNPGSSFAIEIARKIGLPEEIIADASQKVGSEYIDMDKYLQDIVRDKRYWESKRQQIRTQEKKLEELTARHTQELETINAQRKEILTTAKTQAAQILADANAKIEQTIRKIKEANAEKEETKAIRRDFNEFREAMGEDGGSRGSRGSGEEKQLRITNYELRKNRGNRKNGDMNRRGERLSPKQENKDNPNLCVGDAVRLKGQQAVGTILEIDEKQVVVAFGTIKSAIQTDRLEKVNKSQIRKETTKHTFISSQTADSMYEKKLHFKLDIDVRGMRGDEALQAVTYFIDDAIQINVSRVRILHGTGNGILRQLIRNYLSTVPGVKHFQDEHVQFGGTGITVVDLE
jgi:DNA mismatch repair protein MutS2